MVRRRADPVQVSIEVTGAPSSFRWRGARFVVLEVQGRWRERHPWWVDLARGDPAPATEHEVWRVLAAGRGAEGVYDLRRDTSNISGTSDTEHAEHTKHTHDIEHTHDAGHTGDPDANDTRGAGEPVWVLARIHD